MATLKDTTINDTGFIQISNGTTGSPSARNLRFNTTSNLLEKYDGAGWKTIAQGNGLDGSSPGRAANNGREILFNNPDATSGNYWIKGDGQPIQVYIDMDGSESGSSLGGWLRIDNTLVNTYRTQGIGETVRHVSHVSNGRYNRSSAQDGVMSGVRWNLGPNINFEGMRITRATINPVSSPDAQSYNSITSGNPSDTQIFNFPDANQSLGSNYASLGWATSDRYGSSVRRYYNGAASGDVWGGGDGTFTLNSSSFPNNTDSAQPAGQYIYWWYTDGSTEYYNLIDYTYWVR